MQNNDGNKKRFLGEHFSKNSCRQESLMDATISRQKYEEKRHLHNPKVSPHKPLRTYKGKTVTVKRRYLADTTFTGDQD